MNEQQLIECLFRQSPIVTDRVLANALGADAGVNEESIRFHANIETIESLVRTLRNNTIFKPFEGVYPVTVERGRIQFPTEFKYIFDLSPSLTLVKKDWTSSMSLIPHGLYDEETQPEKALRPEISLDSYGRLYLPKYFRGIADIGRKAVIVGAYDQVIIADETKFSSFIAR